MQRNIQSIESLKALYTSPPDRQFIPFTLHDIMLLYNSNDKCNKLQHLDHALWCKYTYNRTCVFVLGMMWMSAANPGASPPLRHWCEQGDRLPFYSWTSHDGVNVGVHEATDDHYTIKSEFVKRPGGEHGGDWTTRLSVRPKVIVLLICQHFAHFVLTLSILSCRRKNALWFIFCIAFIPRGPYSIIEYRSLVEFGPDIIVQKHYRCNPANNIFLLGGPSINL